MRCNLKVDGKKPVEPLRPKRDVVLSCTFLFAIFFLIKNLKMDAEFTVGKDFQYTFKGEWIFSEKSGRGDKNEPCLQLGMEAIKETAHGPDRLPIVVSPSLPATSP